MTKETSTQVLQPGFKLQSKEGVYEIVKVLGSGSFGITYLATAQVSIGNISTIMKFAIKEHFVSASCYRGDDGATVCIVPNAKSNVVDSRADFITEANRLKKLCLKSRNIVSVNETFEANGTAYYVMEFLDGGSPSRCSEKEAISIVMQIAGALDEIHKEHVLHLDIKPDNIVLKTNEKNETYPVLIDFGISKHFDSKGRPTSSLSAKGASPGFAPQEQYAGVCEFSPKYDIYALGAVLFFLCTGKNPPDAFKISPNQQELKKELVGKVSSKVEKAILNAMKPAASERTPNVKRFCDDLMGIDFVPVLSVPYSRLDFSQDKGMHRVSVDSNIEWIVCADEDWCKVAKIGNTIVISVSKNKETGSRAGNVVVSGSSYQLSQVIHINQKGSGTVIFPSGPTWWERNCKRVYQASGILLGGCFILGLCVLLKPDSEKESRLLTEAIEAMDGKTLKKFAEKDSIRAYLPFAQFLINQSEFEDAILYANKTNGTIYSEKAKSLIDSITHLIDSQPVSHAIALNENKLEKPIHPDFVLIESGSYNYSGWNEKTQSKYKINVPVDSFYISKYELTQGEYKRVMGTLTKENTIYGTGEYGGEPYKQIEGDSIPVKASLKEIAEYCNRRSQLEGYQGFYKLEDPYVILNKDGNGYRIPTKIEWLFAAHGGNLHENYKYSGGNKLGEVAWFGGNSGRKPHPVGQKKPNGKGLYDMTGNADEYLWSSIFNEEWYPHPYMNYYMWVGIIDEIVGSQRNMGARIVLIQNGSSNNNLNIQNPSVPNRMKNLQQEK